MSINLSKVVFDSRHPIDKIVQQGSISITNDGNTTTNGTGKGEQAAKIVEQSVTNEYGRAALVRFRWSIDGGSNWQGMESQLLYSFTLTFTDFGITETLQGLRAACSVGTSNTNINFRTANGYHGDVSTTTSNPVGTGYTPISQTFMIEYALYERE